MNSRPANAVAIAASRLTHRYGRTRVLHDVDLDVPQGATCALLGANGAGKTTLLRLLAGIEEVQDGRVALFGADVDDLTLRQRQQVAYVAEGQELPGWMTVAQLEAYCAPLIPRGMPRWPRGCGSGLRWTGNSGCPGFPAVSACRRR
jgi:ABC-type multidrug transport system ATPase subunit